MSSLLNEAKQLIRVYTIGKFKNVDETNTCSGQCLTGQLSGVVGATKYDGDFLFVRGIGHVSANLEFVSMITIKLSTNGIIRYF